MSKNIIICFDGTGNQFGVHNTNVVHTMKQLPKSDQQVACYDPGVGTFDFMGKARKVNFNITLEKAFGYGLELKIFNGYKFLMRYYHPGDQIFIFGFSRGAFTARALAGMLYKCGLLEDLCYNLIPSVADIYFQQNNTSLAQQFKQTFCRSCKPHFVGVWDTVKSLGYFFGKSFSDEILNSEVCYGYQALAIDEQRQKFKPSLWDESRQAQHQRIEQVWFMGAHADVGGGYPERGLSDIALQWLLQKAQQCGLLLNANWQNTLSPDPLAPLHKSRTGKWKLWPAYTRVIPEGALIHKSVLARKANDKYYRPQLPDQFSLVE